MYLTYDDFCKSVETVLSNKRSIITHECINDRIFELCYINGVMYEISDTNDSSSWRILRVNSLNSFEIIKNSNDYYSSMIKMAPFFKKEMRTVLS